MRGGSGSEDEGQEGAESTDQNSWPNVLQCRQGSRLPTTCKKIQAVIFAYKLVFNKLLAKEIL